jgi:hypothetical protein
MWSAQAGVVPGRVVAQRCKMDRIELPVEGAAESGGEDVISVETEGNLIILASHRHNHI